MPATVISSGSAGLDDVETDALALFCGSGASGNDVEVPVETLSVAGCTEAICAEQSRPIESRRDAVRQRQEQNFG